MKNQFNILKNSRTLTLKVIDSLTLEQLHKIPDGFKNNIVWNIAHLVVTQQLLHYKLSGLQCLCSDDLIATHKKGTFPTISFSQEEFNEVLDLFIGLPATLEEDFEAGIFNNFTEYPTSTGFVLNSIETAISFNNYHEAMHLGIIMSIKKLV